MRLRDARGVITEANCLQMLMHHAIRGPWHVPTPMHVSHFLVYHIYINSFCYIYSSERKHRAIYAQIDGPDFAKKCPFELLIILGNSMSLCKKTVSLYAGSRVPIQKICVPIRRGPCTRASLVQGLLEDPGKLRSDSDGYSDSYPDGYFGGF